MTSSDTGRQQWIGLIRKKNPKLSHVFNKNVYGIEFLNSHVNINEQKHLRRVLFLSYTKYAHNALCKSYFKHIFKHTYWVHNSGPP